eukprot:Phypoly_transcript_01148.p1 GENE.Phypoly_transcript_01148~~Phypoly_transcript_01148.p1  ORF type:complete len:746 (+),score=87.76 Phypoly_transcript_01148:82-2319(+)
MAYSHQKNLHKVVQEIFGENIISNVRKNASFINPSSNKYLEIDLWVPDHQICFEFQDSYHYVATWYSHSPLDTIQNKDILKFALVRERGETLVIVPCWWDGDEGSLKATLHAQRPDIVPRVAPEDLPIPLNPSIKFFHEEKEIPGIGQLMLASLPEISNKEFLRSVTNQWWMGEKYDGVRCSWNHIDKSLYSRRGQEIYLLPAFSRLFPATAHLDGEIWFGRGLNSDAQRLIVSPEYTSWQQLRVIGFDDPSSTANARPFEDRYATLVSVLDTLHPFLILAPRVDCRNKTHIVRTTKYIIRDGGEGTIVRRHTSPYVPGRSPLLYKLKALRGEQEALVVRQERKSLLLRLPDGMTFPVPIEKNQFPHMEIPKKGDVVTITYDHYSRRERPSNPRVLRKRSDVTWQNVLRDYGVVTSSRELNDKTTLVFKTPKNLSKLSDKMDAKQMRQILETYARNSHLDPLNPATWYSVPILDIKGVRYMCQKLQCSSISLVLSLFPEIGLDEDKFPLRPNYYWKSEKNRRKFFDDFAGSQNFDPLIPKNWYDANWSVFYDLKSAFSLMKYYGGSYRKALCHLYPNIGLSEHEFTFKPQKYWQSLDNRRDFLERFARLKGFDPLVVQNWYKVSANQVEEIKGGQSMLEYYHGSLYKALLHLYPTIPFDNTLFIRNPRYHWREAKNTRAFLDNFAKDNQFDPLIAENWYKVSTIALKKAKGRGILKYYKSLARALIHLYPEVEFQFRKFQNITKS